MDEPPERQVKHFRFRQMRKVALGKPRWPETINDRQCLVAVSNKFGLIFAASDSGFHVIKTTDLDEFDRSSGANLPRTVAVETGGSAPCHLAVTCDDLTFSVVAKKDEKYCLLLYDIASFQGDKPRPFYGASLGRTAVSVLWNPSDPQLLATCFSDGSLSVLQFDSKVSVVASLPSTEGVCSMCWSPKGKQLAVGHSDGRITQHLQDLNLKKTIPMPDCFDSRRPVVDFVWLSTYVFGVVYAGADGPSLILLSMPKGATQPVVTNFEDVYMGSNQRTEQYFFKYIADWNVLLTGSANSAEVYVLSHQEQKMTLWERWDIDDDARAEIPFFENFDMFPAGMAFDITSQSQIQISETKMLPPCPTLLLMSTSGELCPYRVINDVNPPRVINQPAISLPAQGGRRPGQATSSALSPSPAITVTPKTTAAASAASAAALAMPQSVLSVSSGLTSAAGGQTHGPGLLTSGGAVVTTGMESQSQPVAMKQGLFSLRTSTSESTNQSRPVQSTETRQQSSSILPGSQLFQVQQQQVKSTGTSSIPTAAAGSKQSTVTGPQLSISTTSLQQPFVSTVPSAAASLSLTGGVTHGLQRLASLSTQQSQPPSYQTQPISTTGKTSFSLNSFSMLSQPVGGSVASSSLFGSPGILASGYPSVSSSAGSKVGLPVSSNLQAQPALSTTHTGMPLFSLGSQTMSLWAQKQPSRLGQQQQQQHTTITQTAVVKTTQAAYQQATHQQSAHQQTTQLQATQLRATHQQATHQRTTQQQASHQQATHQQAAQQQAAQQQAPQQQGTHQQATQQQSAHQQTTQLQATQLRSTHQQATQQQAAQQQAPQQQGTHQQAAQQQATQHQSAHQQVTHQQATRQQATHKQATRQPESNQQESRKHEQSHHGAVVTQPGEQAVREQSERQQLKPTTDRPESPPTVKSARTAEDLDVAFGQAIEEEIEKFANELQVFEDSVYEKFYDSSVEDREDGESDLVGSQEEMWSLKHHTEQLQQDGVEIVKKAETMSADVDYLKENVLEGFAMAEEARMRKGRQVDPRHIGLHRTRPLDPESAHKLKSLRTQYQQVTSAIRDINHVLDLEWDERQQQQRQRQRGRLARPALDSVYRSLKNHHSIAASQVRAVSSLARDMHQLHLVSLSQPWKKPSEPGDAPALDSLLELQGGTRDSSQAVMDKRAANKPMPPKKQAQLRAFFSQIQTTPIRTASPARHEARREAEDRIKEITASLDSPPSSLVQSVASSQASLCEDEANKPGRSVQYDNFDIPSQQVASGMFYVSQLSGSSSTGGASHTAQSTSTPYSKAPITSTGKNTQLFGQPMKDRPTEVALLPLQHKGGTSSTRTDQQPGIQGRSAFQPPASSHVAVRPPGQQNFQSVSSRVFVSGSTVQYGALQVSPAQQAGAAALKRADAKTDHLKLLPKDAAVAVRKGPIHSDEVEWPLQGVGTSVSTISSKSIDTAAFYQKPGDVSTSISQPAVVSSESGSSRPGFAQFLSMSSSSLAPAFSSKVSPATASTVTTVVTSTHKSIVTTKPFLSSSSMTGAPFSFNLDSVTKTVSSAKPSVSTVSTQSQSTPPATTATFEFKMPAMFTSTTSSGSNSAVDASSVPSMFSFHKPDNSSSSGGFGKNLSGTITTEAGTTATSSAFAFDLSSFKTAGESGKAFTFAGISATAPVVAQKSGPTGDDCDLSTGHQSDSSCPGSDSGSDTDRAVPLTTENIDTDRAVPLSTENISAPQGNGGETEHVPDPAETTQQALTNTTTPGSASVIPDSTASVLTVPGLTMSTVSVDTVTSQVSSSQGPPASAQAAVSTGPNSQSRNNAAAVTVTAGIVSDHSAHSITTLTTSISSTTDDTSATSNNGSNQLPPVTSISSSLPVQLIPTTTETATTVTVSSAAGTITSTSTAGSQDSPQPASVFEKSLLDSLNTDSGSKSTEQSNSDTQVDSTTADIEGDEMADVEAETSSDFVGLGSLGLGRQSNTSVTPSNPFALKQTAPSIPTQPLSSGLNSQHLPGISSGAINFGGSSSTTSAGLFSQTNLPSNVGVTGFGISQTQSATHGASGFGAPSVFGTTAFGTKPTFGSQLPTGTGLQGRVFGGSSGLAQPTTNLFGEIASQQQSGFGGLAVGGATQDPMAGGVQQGLFGAGVSSTFGQGGGGSMFGSGQQQSGFEAAFGSQQPYSGNSSQSSAFTARRK